MSRNHCCYFQSCIYAMDVPCALEFVSSLHGVLVPIFSASYGSFTLSCSYLTSWFLYFTEIYIWAPEYHCINVLSLVHFSSLSGLITLIIIALSCFVNSIFLISTDVTRYCSTVSSTQSMPIHSANLSAFGMSMKVSVVAITGLITWFLI